MTRKASPLTTQEIGGLVMLVNQERLDDAAQGARRLLKVHPNAGMLWKILSVALVRQGKDALEALRKTAELMPHDAEAHRNLGAAFNDRGQWANGLASLRRALELSPNDTDSLVDAADALRASGRPRDSIPLYQRSLTNQRALQDARRLIDVRNNLGNAYLQISQYAEAAASYRLALEMKPDDPMILCNLSTAARRLGDLDTALRLGARALAIAPELAATHNNLGLVFSSLGQRDQAVESLRQALLLQPDNVEALNNLGDVLRDIGLRRDAMPLYARAIEIDPSRVESHWNFGTALFELGRTHEAAASFSRALVIQPDHAPAHLSLGLVLRQQRRPDDAEVSCQAALAIDPTYVEALSFLGELRADRGRFAEAENLFQRAIAINPDFSFAYFSIATHRKMTSQDGVWLQGAERLLAKPLPLRNQISLRYALGKYCDDLTQYEQAFDHYRHANELTKRYGFSYDKEKLTQRIDQIIQRFDSTFIKQQAGKTSDSEIPIFILGMPRSGTSLTEQILASHPAVFGAGEVTFWDAAFGKFDSQLLSNVANEYLQRLTASARASPREASRVAARIVDKMPANFLYAGMIHAAFPRARIIHMQRHPIDTCLSIYFQNFLSTDPYANDLGNLAHYYREYLRIMDHWRALLPPSALLEVPYEQLIDDQEGWSRKMLDFVGLAWDPRCLDFHQTDRVVITASKWQVRQKMTRSSQGRWRHYEKFVEPLLPLLDLAL